MTEKTVFKKIIDGDIPADIVFQDDHCLVFRDVSPQAPTHLLVIPKKEIPSLDALQDEDHALAGHLLMVIARLARELNLGEGFRVVCNCGEEAGQLVPHLHFHVLAGRPLSWPPG
ncbi:MAG: histidine triad nucleotide-binding protein [Planctomycetota bacterium]